MPPESNGDSTTDIIGRMRAKAAARNGKGGFEPVLDGFEIAKTSVTKDQSGKTIRTHITQRPEAGPEFAPPPGFLLQKVTVAVDQDGRVTKQWPRYSPGADATAAGIEAVKAIFEEYKGRAELVPAPGRCDDDLATLYVIGDHHLGMYSWAAETGADYDVTIGERLLREAMNNLVDRSPDSHTGIILSLGDFFHTDSSSNRTPESGNSLDVDTRRTRVAQVGLKLMIDCIELALEKHWHVIVRCLPGNHDPETTPWLSLALWAFFHSNPRITVDCSPSRFWFWQFGKVMLAATHGDKCRPHDLPSVMARDQAEMWGQTVARYGMTGHVHHKEKIGREIGGAFVESFQVLAGRDSWHAGMGYGAGRSMTAVTFHREFGRDGSHEVSVRRLESLNG